MNTFSTIGSRTATARRIAAACGVGVLLLGAGACGSEDPAPVSQGTAADAGPSTTQQTQGQRPGANGTIAAVTDSTAQVQSSDSGQVAVTWSASTTFTTQASAQLADVTVGDCVMVSSGEDAGTAEADSSAVTATSVRITEPVDGSCAPTGAGPGGGGPGGAPGGGTTESRPQLEGGEPPAGGGGTPPSGAPQIRGFGGAFGEVTAVSGTGFVVASTRFAAPQDGSSTPTQEDVDVTVTVNASTTYTTTVAGSADDVEVGQCLQADGEADDTGAISATRIAVTAPVDGACGASFRRALSGAAPGDTTQGS